MRSFRKYPSNYVKAGRENRRYSNYYGAAARDDIGQYISEMYRGEIISKRMKDDSKSYGLKRVAEDYLASGKPFSPDNFDEGETLDLWYILEALEGMCYNDEAVEVADGFYYIGSYDDWRTDMLAQEQLAVMDF